MSQKRKSLKTALSGIFMVSGCLLAEVSLAAAGNGAGQAAIQSGLLMKVIAALVALATLPLILTGLIREIRAEKRALNDLQFVSRYNQKFNWDAIKQRATDCVQQMHHSHQSNEMPVVSDCMTDWYWRNQQNVFIDKWRNEGLLNVRHIKRLTRVKPVLFLHRNHGALQEGSVVVMSVRAWMQNYFIDRESGELIDGHKHYQMVDKIWSFMYSNGEWRISNIEDEEQRNHYEKLASYLPKIEETVMYYSGTKVPERNSDLHQYL